MTTKMDLLIELEYLKKYDFFFKDDRNKFIDHKMTLKMDLLVELEDLK
jgi:hypothetical protein